MTINLNRPAKSKTSATDTTSGNLFDEIVAGSNVSISVLNSGADEKLQISATSGTITASSVTVTPTGNISSTNVQTALAELDSEKASLTGSETLTSKKYKIAESLGTNLGYEGLVFQHTAGENFTFGQVGYYKSDGKIWKADADGSLTFPVVVIALEAITGNTTGLFLKIGSIRDDSWNWTIGGPIYLSETAGGITQTAPVTSLSVVQVLGFAFPNADTIQFNPSPDYFTLT